MLELVDLRRLFERLGTPAAGRTMVEDARRLAPVREVRSSGNNVITRFHSRKMARMVDTESRTVEYPAAVMYEHDPRVIEYYPQPMRLDITIQEEGKRRVSRIQHTPDFLLIREDGLWVEEWREEPRLEKLRKKYPGRFIKDAAGWHYPIVENHLRDRGIGYRLRSGNEHPRTYIQNLIFLADYLQESWPGVDETHLHHLRSAFHGQSALPLLHLIQRGKDAATTLYTADHVYKAIADRELHFDLYQEALAETNRVMVYLDAPALELAQRLAEKEQRPAESLRDTSLKVGAIVDYDGAYFTVVRVGTETATLQNRECTFDQKLSVLLHLHQEGSITVQATEEDSQAALHPLQHLSPRAVEEILTRRRWLEQAETDPHSVPRSARTLQRYRKAMQEAGGSESDQQIALASRIQARGNRTRKIPQKLLELVEQVAKEHYNTPRNIKKTTAYRYFLQACEKEDLRPCSMKTFNKELDARACTRSRKGKRWAYQEEPVVWYLNQTEPLHGVRPFQYVHIDHTQLDLQLVGWETRKNLGKPWLTLAVDAESRDISGFYLSFEPPSYRSCMMVLRDLVRRHQKLPAMLVLDNGKEFHSQALARVCEFYGCSLRYRPGGKPRYGSVMERVFGTTNTQFIHQLEGNTQLMKTPRSLTKAVLPENFAAWTLPQLHGALDFYFQNLYGSTEHPAHGEAPAAHFKRRMTETGERQHRLVRFDESFRVETCPPPSDRPTRQVDGRRGIKIHNLWFWNDAFATAELRKKEVQVRIDPFDPGTAFALVKGQWVPCRSKLHPMLRQLTDVERRYYFEEVSRQLKGRIGSLGEHRLAEWLQVLDPTTFDPKLSEQEAQGKIIYGALGMTQAMSPSAAPPPDHAPVVPLKGRKRQPTHAEPESPNTPRGVTPIEAENDDYSLF